MQQQWCIYDVTAISLQNLMHCFWVELLILATATLLPNGFATYLGSDIADAAMLLLLDVNGHQCVFIRQKPYFKRRENRSFYERKWIGCFWHVIQFLCQENMSDNRFTTHNIEVKLFRLFFRSICFQKKIGRHWASWLGPKFRHMAVFVSGSETRETLTVEDPGFPMGTMEQAYNVDHYLNIYP